MLEQVAGLVAHLVQIKSCKLVIALAGALGLDLRSQHLRPGNLGRRGTDVLDEPVQVAIQPVETRRLSFSLVGVV